MSSVDLFGMPQFTRKLQAAWRSTCKATALQCTREIESEKWKWKGVTVRSDGRTVSTPRNIEDTGELKNSQVLSFPTADQGTIEYTAGHSLKVHEGDSGTQARPWMRSALKVINPPKHFAAEARKRLR